MTPHPGKTPAQRRVLDAIGCGDSCPPMAKTTRDSLLSDGLIIELGRKTVGADSLGPITVPIFEMPIPVHMQWCQHCAEQETDA